MENNRFNPPNTAVRVLSRLMVPNLASLTSQELIDMYIMTAKQFAQSMHADACADDLERIEAQIAVIKDEIYKKGSLTPESFMESDYFYRSLINGN